MKTELLFNTRQFHISFYNMSIIIAMNFSGTNLYACNFVLWICHVFTEVKRSAKAMQQQQTQESVSSTIMGCPEDFRSSYISLMSIILFSSFSIDQIWLGRLFLFTKMAGSLTKPLPFCNRR